MRDRLGPATIRALSDVELGRFLDKAQTRAARARDLAEAESKPRHRGLLREEALVEHAAWTALDDERRRRIAERMHR